VYPAANDVDAFADDNGETASAASPSWAPPVMAYTTASDVIMDVLHTRVIGRLEDDFQRRWLEWGHGG
jgi:hypothetical protein